NVVFDTEKAEDGTTQLIIDFKVFGVKKTVANVLHEAFNWTLSLGRMVVLSLTDLVSGRIPVNNLSGPVGIVTAIGEASSAGLETLLMLLALITVNLGIFNILPLPALDGGKLVFLILEAIRRKPINQKYEIAINAAGFVLLIGIMLFATFNDITRLIR
ncbi:MAG: site-2 protease family protein, partial [Ruthenibacterium sp.]